MMLTYNVIVENLLEKKNFSYSRWGDGEFSSIFGRSGKNRDCHEYFSDLGQKLLLILKSNPKYYLGIRDFTPFELSKMTQNTTSDGFSELLNNIEWESTEILVEASIKERLYRFFQALRERKVLLIGNFATIRIREFPHDSIEVMIENCWIYHKKYLDKILKRCKKDLVILYCAGMMSNYLIDEVYKIFGDEVTQIDCGSVFDPYVGRRTRGYHFKLMEGWENEETG